MLYLNDNQLVEVPNAVGALTQLKVLYLENNVVSHDVNAEGVPRGLALIRHVRGLGYRLFWDRFRTRLAAELGISYVESNMLCVPEEWWRADAGTGAASWSSTAGEVGRQAWR